MPRLITYTTPDRKSCILYDVFYDVRKKNAMHYPIEIYINDSSGFVETLVNLAINHFNVVAILLLYRFYINAT